MIGRMPDDGQADAGADDGGLRDRGVDDASLAEAARWRPWVTRNAPPMHADVLAEEDDAVVVCSSSSSAQRIASR